MKNKIILCFALMTAIMLTTGALAVGNIPKWNKIQLGTDQCVYEPINQKHLRNPISFSDYWYNKVYSCNMNIFNVDLESDFVPYKASPCDGKQVFSVNANKCIDLEQPRDVKTLKLDSNVYTHHDRNIWSVSRETELDNAFYNKEGNCQ